MGPENATFSVDIEITGLCMFVPAKDNSAMHVLMPRVKPGTHPHSHDEDASGQLGADMDEHHPRLECKGVSIALNGFTLDLAHYAGPIDTRIPPEVVNLSASDYTGKKFNLAKVGSKLISRVILKSGCISRRNGIAEWALPDGRNVIMANWARWTISGLTGSELVLRRANLHGKFPVPFVHIPAEAGETISLVVRHVPTEELTSPGSGQRPEENDPPKHFHGFFELFDIGLPNPDAHLPRFVGDASLSGDDEPTDYCGDETFRRDAPVIFGKTYSCMTLAGLEEAP